LFRLARFLKNYKKECIIGPVCKFLEAVLELLLPTIMAVIINDGVDSRNMPLVLRLGGLMAALSCLGYCFALVCQFLAARASQGVGTDLRDAVFAKISGMSYTQTESFGAATLTNRITNDVNQLQQWVAMMIRLLVRAPFICIGAMIMAVILSPKLSVILFCCIPVLAAIIWFVTAHTAPLYRTYQKCLDRLGLVLGENLSGVRVIRAFAKKDAERARFGGANGELCDTGMSIGSVTSLFNPLTALTVNISIILILWAGGWQISLGGLRQGEVIAYISYVNQILYSLLVVSNLIVLLTKSMASAARINEVLDAPEPKRAQAAVQLDPKAPAVEFDRVSFSYGSGSEKALEDVTLSAARGETVGIIGGTGSGKTTLANLIAHFCEPDSGTIKIFGEDIRNIPDAQLRAAVSIVPQRSTLFSGTVADNIRFGRPDAAESEVAACARAAQAEEFILGLDGGYSAPVERGGANLSGGQRQRLAIARALCAQPGILILDDSSSALDFATEARLRSELRKAAGDAAIFFISQRVGTVMSADRILVLDSGRVCGFGTHSELMRTCGLYRDICASQLSEAGAQTEAEI
jgi:ATP-binding cassette subfamily B multidrug efflux pump